MFPWIGHGHVFPYLELAKNLSAHNFDIFFCSTAVNLSSITDVLANTSSSVSIQLVELHLPSSPELPPCRHTTKNAPPRLLPKLHQAFQMSISSFSDIITSLNPDMLIYDGFQPWAAKIASSLGIPAVHFATSGAAPYSFYFHSFMSATSAFPYEEIYLRDYERKAYEAMVFSDLGVKKNDLDSAIGHFTLSCDVVLMKTCRAVEGKYMDYLSVLCKKKLVPVGPLVAHANSEEGKHGEIMEWLIVAMPLKLDQPFNARLVVEASVGIEVERDENGGFSGADVADVINKVVVEETGEDMRLKAAELSEKMKIEEEDAMNDAADQLRRLCMEHKQQK
ncbi:UNVERIFIED_CONTAM: UDP-glucosyltransferase 29 [Sesamum radiatum]|uniref:UDP-glucosyltransferase 29 n=1 Tax=Sesamum radiatum TaxID=300843 RepID=A0AAW2UFF6_SESRA